MSDHDALLAAILANPDDDTPRLMFADWLQEHCDEAQAEFIRASVAKARIPKCANPSRVDGEPTSHTEQCEYCTAKRREWFAFVPELSVKSWHRLPSPVHLSPGGILRGFIEGIACGAGDWLQHANAILAAHPVHEVRLMSMPAMFHVSAVSVPDRPYGFDSALNPNTSKVLDQYIRYPTRTHRELGLDLDDDGNPSPFQADDPVMQRRLAQRLLKAQWPRINFTLPRPR